MRHISGASGRGKRSPSETWTDRQAGDDLRACLVAEGSDLRRRLGRNFRACDYCYAYVWQREAISVGDLDDALLSPPWQWRVRGRGKRSPSETWTSGQTNGSINFTSVAEGSDLRRRLGHDLSLGYNIHGAEWQREAISVGDLDTKLIVATVPGFTRWQREAISVGDLD